MSNERAVLVRAEAKKTIVVVDDEPGVCETLRDVFEDQGYEVGIATDGSQALVLLRALPKIPCIVLLDMIMPVLDGNAVYQAMKADPLLSHVAIVVMTSDPSRAPSGANVMKKPVALGVLIDTVRKCCETPA